MDFRQLKFSFENCLACGKSKLMFHEYIQNQALTNSY
jgi:ferredoxin-like protein FixX